MANRTIIINSADDTAGRAVLRKAFSEWTKWPLRITLANARPRSTKQNSRHWAILTECGYESESERIAAHYDLCGEFFGWGEPDKLGRRRPLKTSSGLTTEEFAALDEWICRRAAECGIIIADRGA
jgi:hypothetical protein